MTVAAIQSLVDSAVLDVQGFETLGAHGLVGSCSVIFSILGCRILEAEGIFTS